MGFVELTTGGALLQAINKIPMKKINASFIS
jgi:hypothetical protein